MPKYLISFNDGDMKFEPEELPQLAEAAHAVMREAIKAGVWVIGGGFEGYSPKVVRMDGSIAEGGLAPTDVVIGGFTIVEVASEAEAHRWAHKIAVACRCDQEVRLIMDDPEQDAALAAASAS